MIETTKTVEFMADTANGIVVSHRMMEFESGGDRSGPAERSEAWPGGDTANSDRPDGSGNATTRWDAIMATGGGLVEPPGWRRIPHPFLRH